MIHINNRRRIGAFWSAAGLVMFVVVGGCGVAPQELAAGRSACSLVFTESQEAITRAIIESNLALSGDRDFEIASQIQACTAAYQGPAAANCIECTTAIVNEVF